LSCAHAPPSVWHVALQPSPLIVLPSSHCSPASTMPLPHTGTTPHVSPQTLVTSPTQMLSQLFVQQNESTAQT
jgi:hypothetical protein